MRIAHALTCISPDCWLVDGFIRRLSTEPCDYSERTEETPKDFLTGAAFCSSHRTVRAGVDHVSACYL
jgi:hypothetical protein